MDNAKAIEIFNKWMDCKDAYQADPSCDGNCFSCEYYASTEEEKESMQTAISALEKQIPMTVNYIGDGYADGCMVYDQAECPNCGYIFDDNEHSWGGKICPECGQAIYWSKPYTAEGESGTDICAPTKTAEPYTEEEQ